MAHAKEKVSMSMTGKTVDASQGRKEMLKIIEGFRKEGEKRRSQVFHMTRATEMNADCGQIECRSLTGSQAFEPKAFKEPSENRVTCTPNRGMMTVV